MRFSEFLAQIKPSKTVPPVFLVTGAESYLREQSVSHIKTLHPDFSSQALRLSASDITPDSLADELYTPAFMGQKKLVVVIADDPHAFGSFKERLGQFLEAPSECAHFVWVAPNAKGWETWKKRAVWVECDGLDERELAAWIVADVQKHGKKIDRAAVERLMGGSESSLASLAGDIEKLCSYVGKRAVLTSQDVDTMVVGSEDSDVRELVQAIEQKSVRGAVTALERLMNRGENAQMVLGYLAWHYRRVIQAASAERRTGKLAPAWEKGYGQEVPARRSLGEGGAGAPKRSRWDELKEKHGRVLKADLTLKTSNAPESLVLETLVCDLAR